MTDKVKMLFLDIETSPNIVLSWRVGYNLSLTPDNIIQERSIICISYKWAGQKRVHHLSWDKNKCDKAMLKRFAKILEEADVVLGHNGDRYDIPFITGRMIYHGLPPCNELASMDTLKFARGKFYFNSNKLDYIGQFLKLGKKLETGGYSLWKTVLLGNKTESSKALKKMISYCDQDVLLLEKVYYKLAPYVKKPVNMAIIAGKSRDNCPTCASAERTKWGHYTTRSARYQRYKCSDCYHIYRDHKAAK